MSLKTSRAAIIKDLRQTGSISMTTDNIFDGQLDTNKNRDSDSHRCKILKKNTSLRVRGYRPIRRIQDSKKPRSQIYIITPKLPALNISIAPTLNTSSISLEKMNASLRVRGYRPIRRIQDSKKPRSKIFIITPKLPALNISIAPTLNTSSISLEKMNASLRVRGYRPTGGSKTRKSQEKKEDVPTRNYNKIKNKRKKNFI